MPRRGRSASPPSSHVPAAAPPSAPMMSSMQPQQPSMFKQMAATAGGVAVGSMVGHVAGNALTGMFRYWSCNLKERLYSLR